MPKNETKSPKKLKGTPGRSKITKSETSPVASQTTPKKRNTPRRIASLKSLNYVDSPPPLTPRKPKLSRSDGGTGVTPSTTPTALMPALTPQTGGRSQTPTYSPARPTSTSRGRVPTRPAADANVAKRSPGRPRRVDKTPPRNAMMAAAGALDETPSKATARQLARLYIEHTPNRLSELVAQFGDVDDKTQVKYLTDEDDDDEADDSDPVVDDDDDEDFADRVSASPTPERFQKRVKRQLMFKARQRTALDDAKLRLHSSELPDKLIKREKECKVIRDFVLNGIERNASQALYISGVPGTGKTVSVMSVMESVKMSTRTDFVFVCVNALELSCPKRLFSVVYKEYTKSVKNISPAKAQQLLNQLFSSIDRTRKPLILLVDEVDMLYTKRQEVVYTIFNWSSMPDSRVSVIAISNTLDLPERILAPRVASRLGSHRLCFQPYSFTELAEIIRYRIADCPAISSDSVELASRKIASLSGDLRKALQLLRRAIDIAIEDCEANGGDLMRVTLTFQHMDRAIRESTTSVRMNYCATMLADEELVFRALVSDLKRSNMEETMFHRLFAEYKELCAMNATVPLASADVFKILMHLAGLNFLSLSPENGQMNRRIMLGIPLSDAQFCIRQLDLAANNNRDADPTAA